MTFLRRPQLWQQVCVWLEHFHKEAQLMVPGTEPAAGTSLLGRSGLTRCLKRLGLAEGTGGKATHLCGARRPFPDAPDFFPGGSLSRAKYRVTLTS